MRRQLLAATLAALACLAAAPAGAAPVDEPLQFTVVLKDGTLTPGQIEAPAGRRIRLVVRNDGTGPGEFESLNPRVEKVLSPGAQSFVVLPKLKPGRYRFIDEYHEHGGELTLVVH